ncbi:unannotated protein [freshwater metagenome]|uniref:Unannotated protein n=1 Tax=freshwater metagenome TaxID=449393 RepID=A0A6J7JNQ6_9ZZZZ
MAQGPKILGALTIGYPGDLSEVSSNTEGLSRADQRHRRDVAFGAHELKGCIEGCQAEWAKGRGPPGHLIIKSDQAQPSRAQRQIDELDLRQRGNLALALRHCVHRHRSPSVHTTEAIGSPPPA